MDINGLNSTFQGKWDIFFRVCFCLIKMDEKHKIKTFLLFFLLLILLL